MSSGVYGGDEVGAIVFDPGHQSIRAGFAGEDTPKADVPSFACSEMLKEEPMEISGSTSTALCKNRKLYLDSNSIMVPRANVEMINFLKDGMIDDWDLFEELLNHIYDKHLMSKSKDHPVLMSESAWNENAKREQITELMFEKYQIPAFFLVKNSVLSAFANGRPTAVVFDSGASQTSAVPVIDGYVIKNGIVRTNVGSDFVADLCKKYLTTQNVELIPSYMVASKQPVAKDQPPIWTKKNSLPAISSSWHSFMETQLLHDFQASVLQILDEPFTKEAVDGVPFTPYEFPNGFNKEFGDERYTIGEVLFDPDFDKSTGSAVKMSMSDVLAKSVSLCDIDYRANLYGSVVISGGNTLLTGFNDRLIADVGKKIPPNVRVKLMHPNGTIERRYSPWIGGSILASLGTFQRMWISKQEYDDGGKSQINRKCA